MIRAITVKEAQINRLRREIETADAIIFGAGAGLSASAGFTYTGSRFHHYFADFEDKYGFHDMYSGGFYPYKTPEERWAYWSRYIEVNRYRNADRPVYENLYELVKDRDYFVITTNVDHCFQKAGFDKNRLFYTQGDYGLFQCSVPCCRTTYDNREIIGRMVKEQKNMRIPSELLPICPVCKKPLTVNLRSDDKFVEDEGWHKAALRYNDFIRRHKKLHILLLELGVGYNTPAIVKYPFWRLTAGNPKAVYACINNGQAFCPAEIATQSVCINNDIGSILEQL